MKRLHIVSSILSLGVILGGMPVAAQAASTFRASVTFEGVEGNHNSDSPTISADGRYVAFLSSSQSLGLNKTTTVDEVFLRDNQTGELTRVTTGINLVEPSGPSSSPSLSADGRILVFASLATNLVPGRGAGIYQYESGSGEREYLVNGEAPVISADGRFVAFVSKADNLVPNDDNRKQDVFVLERLTGQVSRVSVSSAGAEGDNESGTDGLAISADGRYVAFQSRAENLITGDTNAREDIFVRDRQTGQTTRESIATSGAQANQVSAGASISADGRYLVFSSQASNLILGDTNAAVDVFLRDRQLNQTRRVSVPTSGVQATGRSDGPHITPSGRYVAFTSVAPNLVADDTNAVADVFVRDLQASTTTRLSLTGAGGESNGASDQAALSNDGRYAAFRSGGSNLVPDDTNGSTDVFVRGPLFETPGTLGFAVQPGGASAGTSFATQPMVEARNLDGTRKWDFSGPIAVAVKSGTGRAGAVLSGVTTVDAVHGVATFEGLSLNLAGTGYVLTATGGGLAGESAPFNVAQVPTHLAFSSQPQGGRVGQPFGAQPVVRVLDAENNLAVDFTGPVSLAVKPGTGAAGAVLNGTSTVNAVAGIATFAGLSLDTAGAGYVLTASSDGLTGADTAGFTVKQSAYTTADAADVLRWAGGLSVLSPGEMGAYDADRDGASAGLLDLFDAARILRKVNGFEPNP
jgi:Tol biopolymer transport system component